MAPLKPCNLFEFRQFSNKIFDRIIDTYIEFFELFLIKIENEMKGRGDVALILVINSNEIKIDSSLNVISLNFLTIFQQDRIDS